MKTKKKWSAALGILLMVSVLFLGAPGVEAWGHRKTTRLVMELTLDTIVPGPYEPGIEWESNGILHVRGRSFTYEVYAGTFVTSDGKTGTYNWGGFSYILNFRINLDTGEGIAWGTWVLPELTFTFDESGESWSGSFKGWYTNKLGPGSWEAYPTGYGTGGDFEGMYYTSARIGENNQRIRDTMIIIDPHGRIGT